MNFKLVVLFVVCLVLVASARPGKKGKKGNKGGKGKKGGPEKFLVKLCEGLDDGTINNSDSAYDAVFTDLEPVCDSLLTFTNGVTPASAEPRRKKGKKGKKNKKNKGKKGNKGGDEPTAAEALLNFCKKLDMAETKGLPDDLPSEITDVFTSIGPICDAAEAIFEASQTTQSTTTTTEANS